MGMFDHITIDESFKFPGYDRMYGMQTKNLECSLISYHINRFGRLINVRDNFDINYDGVINVIGTPSFKMTKHSTYVEFDLNFINGFLVCISKTQSLATETDGFIKINIPLWMKLYRILHITWFELKMIFKPPERNQRYLIPETNNHKITVF